MLRKALICAVISLSFALAAQFAIAADAAELSKDSQAALKSLYAKVPAANALGPKARAILVFPKISKAGLGVGGQTGNGALLKGGKAVGYYNTSGGSYGLQAACRDLVTRCSS